MTMLIVLGTARLGEGALDAGREALETMIAASLQEEGCIEYAYSVDFSDPNLLRITEKWIDDAALALHFQTPHMAAFQKALAGLDVTITQVAKFQADEGSPLM